MKNKCSATLAVALLASLQAANADRVQSSTSVFLTFRPCVSGTTVCDSVGPVQMGTYGGLPGDSAALTKQADPAYGTANGSAKLTGAPGAAVLSASATSLPAVRNGGNSFVLQRYTNASGSTETLTFGATLTYDQTVPTENTGFPVDGATLSGANVEMFIFTLDAVSYEVGTTAEENNSALTSGPGPGIGYKPLKEAVTGQLPNVTGAGKTTLSRTMSINPGDSIWLWVGLQSFAANGAVVDASLDTKLEPTTVDKLLKQLLATVTAANSATGLADKVALAQVHYAAKEIQATCAVLQDFRNDAQASDITDVIGCTL